jgi:glycerol uptake facilitator-like aquaporin
MKTQMASEPRGVEPIAAPDGAADAVQTGIVTRLAAEAAGSGILSFIIVAAGLMAERGAGGSVALATLITALAASAGLLALSRALSPWAPCLFNPALALTAILGGRLDLVTGILSAAAQIGAGFFGVMVAHLTTNTGLVQVATQIQTGPGVWTGEVLGTGVFVFTVLTLQARGGRETPVALSGAVALLAIALATPSLCLANPALTLARALTDSFTAIRLTDAAQIAGLQCLAAIAAWLLTWWLSPPRES